MTPPERVDLGVLPTPLHPAPVLGELLGIDRLWLKRDDLIGFSWGGNKVRTAAYLLGDALRSGADTVVVCGGPTSNFVAVMAAAAVASGLAVHQVSSGSEPAVAPPALAASRLAGATVTFTGAPDREGMEPAAEALAATLRARGARPYVVPRGGATVIGALGFADAALELSRQLALAGVEAATVVIPVGSGGSIAGLLAGSTMAPQSLEIVGVSVSRPPGDLSEDIAAKAAACADLMLARAGRHARSPWQLVDGRGPGFGIADRATDELADRIGRRTGLLVDRTYNAKALAWLHAARPGGDAPVVYWHTGGALGAAARLGVHGGPTPSPEEQRP